MAANLFTLFRYDGKFVLKPGIRLDFHKVEDKDGNVLGTVNGLVMGPRYGFMARRALIIPLDHANRPELGNSGDFAFRGTFAAPEGGKNPHLRSFDPALDKEGTCYLRVRTGFDPNVRGGATAEIGRMAQVLGLKPGEPFKAARHGSVALEAGPAMHQLLGLGNDATTEEAEEIWKVIGRVGAFGVPPFTDTLWRLSPLNAAVLSGDIQEQLALVVNDKGQLREAGTEGLRPVFEGLLPSRKAK